MTLKNVTIGDKFINPTNRKSKRVSTVVDFLETKSVTTGEIVTIEIVAEHDFLGQKIKTVCSPTTVLINKIN